MVARRIKCLYIAFYCDENEYDDIHEFARQYFHPLPLRYRIERDYPESGWCTPAFGVPIDVSVTLSAPKGQQLHYREILRIGRDFQNELSSHFESIEDFEKEIVYDWHLH